MSGSKCRSLARLASRAQWQAGLGRPELHPLLPRPCISSISRQCGRAYHPCGRSLYPERNELPNGLETWSGSALLSHHSEATIFAPSTAPGRAGISIVRISGPLSTTIYRALCPAASALRPRHATLRSLYSPDLPPSPATVLDNALLLFFPGPKSVTGEDILELHLHGGPAILAAVLAAIPRCAPAGRVRPADPGEFTRRAFQSARMDLVQVEALGDTVSAVTEAQRRVAVRGSASGLGAMYERWRGMLLEARGEMEALIDFSEDQHFDESPAELVGSVSRQIVDLKEALVGHVQAAMRGELLRSGIAVTLLGMPNAGKSSLLNRIVKREAAIVSPEPGTTRDVVEVAVDIGGYLVRFGDTAGLRSDATSGIEKEGMRRARTLAKQADLVVAVLPFGDDGTLEVDALVMQTLRELKEGGHVVHVAANKTDLAGPAGKHQAQGVIGEAIGADVGVSFITCRANDHGGISALMVDMTQHFSTMTAAAPEAEDALSATARQRALMEECISHLDAFSATAMGHEGVDGQEVDLVLAAEHLRGAAACLARITGRAVEQGDVEEVLGVVFEKFCVGK